MSNPLKSELFGNLNQFAKTNIAQKNLPNQKKNPYDFGSLQ